MKIVGLLLLLAGCVAEETVPVVVAAPQSGASQGVIVLTDKRVARPTEVLGVLDFHSNAANQEKGFEELRARAASMGADAVIAAEFEHGEQGAPSHLSGLAVRFLDH